MSIIMDYLLNLNESNTLKVDINPNESLKIKFLLEITH